MLKTRILPLVVSLLLVVTLVIAGCAKSSPTATPAPAPTVTVTTTAKPAPAPTVTVTPAPAPAPTVTVTASPPPATAQFAKRTWYYAHSYAAGTFEAWNGDGKPLAEELSRLTGGAITIVERPAAALLSMTDMALGVARGIADFGYMNAGQFPALFPSAKIGGIADPLIVAKYPHVPAYWGYLGSVAASEDRRIHAEFAANGLKPLMMTPGAVSLQNIMTSKKISRLDDMKGMKLRLWGGTYQDRLYKAMGAVGVPVPRAEYVDAVKKGIVEGVLSVAGSFYQEKLTEVTPYLLTVPGADYFAIPTMGGAFFVVMNLSVWNGLTDAEKQAVLKAAKVAEAFGFDNYAKAVDEPSFKAMKADPKYTFTALPLADIEKVMSDPLVVNQWQDLAKEIDEAKGQGTKLVNRYLEVFKLSDDQIKQLWEQMWGKRIAELW
ncbi:MAG: TRAP transporter substrate-binding protein DctP [Chloroflexi bacterium]|nr:TRAP transporter substrate-binding protein DctP [Chloroflexota bacterium]